MLTTIGKTAAPADTVDLLVECHERIRTFLAMARRIAEARTAGPEEVQQAAQRVSRYFTQALPLHARDEEDSILPRLRGKDPAVDAELATMTREHLEHEAPMQALVRACDALAGDPGRHGELAATIGTATAELERHFAAHLRREEEVIFPAIRRHLDARANAEVVQEIRGRRGVVEAAGSSTPASDSPAGSELAASEANDSLGTDPEHAGPIQKLLEADHIVLDALLRASVEVPGQIDRSAYDDFREGLLRHIAVEEKILLLAAHEAHGGPIPEARQLRVEHGALAALLVPTPTPEIVEEIRKILGPHNALEEEGGVYRRCEELLGERMDEIAKQIRQYPRVKVARYHDGPRVCRTAEDALRVSSMQTERRQ